MQVGKQFHWWFGLLNWTRVVSLWRKVSTYKKYLAFALSNWIRGKKEREKSWVILYPLLSLTPGSNRLISPFNFKNIFPTCPLLSIPNCYWPNSAHVLSLMITQESFYFYFFLSLDHPPCYLSIQSRKNADLITVSPSLTVLLLCLLQDKTYPLPSLAPTYFASFSFPSPGQSYSRSITHAEPQCPLHLEVNVPLLP